MLLGNSTVQCISHTAEHENREKKDTSHKENSDGSCANLGQVKKMIQKTEENKSTGKKETQRIRVEYELNAKRQWKE